MNDYLWPLYRIRIQLIQTRPVEVEGGSWSTFWSVNEAINAFSCSKIYMVDLHA